MEQNGQDIMERISRRNQLRNTGGNYSKVTVNSVYDLKDLQYGI